jgi:Ricin-type beta-trefoil lectin domain-like
MSHMRSMTGLVLAIATLGVALVGSVGTAGAAPSPRDAQVSQRASSAAAKDVVPFGFYRVVNPITRKCMDVRDRSRAAGAGVHQWHCTTEDNQVWRMVPSPTADGFFWIQNSRSSMCLDIRTTSPVPSNGTGTMQNSCSSARSQNWALSVLVPGGVPAYQIRSELGQFCLDLNDGTQDDGGRIQVWRCEAPFNNHQYWQLIGA